MFSKLFSLTVLILKTVKFLMKFVDHLDLNTDGVFAILLYKTGIFAILLYTTPFCELCLTTTS